MSEYENDRLVVPRYHLVPLADALDTTVDYLVEGGDDLSGIVAFAAGMTISIKLSEDVPRERRRTLLRALRTWFGSVPRADGE